MHIVTGMVSLMRNAARVSIIVFGCMIFSGMAMQLFALPVKGADFYKGIEAFDRKDYFRALENFRPLAEEGDAGAQAALGAMD